MHCIGKNAELRYRRYLSLVKAYRNTKKIPIHESEVLKHGKNISAQEAPEKKGTRLQKAYEDLQRQKGSQEKTP